MTPPTEKRHFTRIPFDARYQLNDPQTNKSWHGEILDISLKGALLHQSDTASFNPGETYRLSLRLDPDLDLTMDVSVAHVEEDTIGVRYDTIDVDSATHLRRILELNLGDIKLLERELAEMIHSDDS